MDNINNFRFAFQCGLSWIIKYCHANEVFLSLESQDKGDRSIASCFQRLYVYRPIECQECKRKMQYILCDEHAKIHVCAHQSTSDWIYVWNERNIQNHISYPGIRIDPESINTMLNLRLVSKAFKDAIDNWSVFWKRATIDRIYEYCMPRKTGRRGLRGGGGGGGYERTTIIDQCIFFDRNSDAIFMDKIEQVEKLGSKAMFSLFLAVNLKYLNIMTISQCDGIVKDIKRSADYIKEMESQIALTNKRIKYMKEKHDQYCNVVERQVQDMSGLPHISQ